MPIQQVLRLRYNDYQALAEELQKLFPDSTYSVEIEMGQFILTLPRELDEDEIASIDSKQRHYQRQATRRRGRKLASED
ncbi:hypothetical protein QBC42DRAFT_54062 [Cladorrhinum samala]|uniref:Uncharacterized protein n=1 Tax=Cladorrhinum samala TaxID=585594 RepID=A0AAV9HVG4_9PEZI|nr:hypothetical protein QBC42DRAFT_54062 [Cladorrhinum samala]